MCWDGRIDGASRSEPIATWTKRSVEKEEEEQLARHSAHLVPFASSSPIVSQPVGAAGDRQFFALDSCQADQKAHPGPSPAPRAVAVGGV